MWESSFDYHGDKHCKQSRSRSPVRKRCKRSWLQSVKSPFDYHGEKCHKRSRSKSPERKRYNRSRSQSLQSPFEYHGKKCCKSQDQDHQKGKDTREVKKIQEKSVMISAKSF